ncbi:MAG: YibE/F family protein [Bacillota bacterium]
MKTLKGIWPTIIVIIISAALIFIYTSMKEPDPSQAVYEKARVIKVTEEKLSSDNIIPGLLIGTQELELELTSGNHKGEVHKARNSLSRLYNIRTKPGMELIVNLEVQDGTVKNVYVHNYKRDNVIYILAALFILVLIIVGGVNGLKSAVSLLFTCVMIICFMLPSILRGGSPILLAIITVSVTTVVSFYLISGWNRKTLAAILGTVSGVVAAGIISYTAGQFAHLSGLTMEESEQLIYIAADAYINIKGLMFAAILIASLGAINDVGMSIASSIFEIHKANSKLNSRELFTSGMNVGKDIMGMMSNTLILAFAGGSLNMMLLIMALKMPYHQLINLDLVCTEVVQGIAGSIGIVLTIPITAAIAVLLIRDKGKEQMRIKK